MDFNSISTCRATIKCLTGITVPVKSDPQFNFTGSGNRMRFTLSNLNKDFSHHGGILLFEGKESTSDWRIRRVVGYSTGLLTYRLCQSGDPAYAAFLVGEYYAILKRDPDYKAQRARLLDAASDLCTSFTLHGDPEPAAAKAPTSDKLRIALHICNNRIFMWAVIDDKADLRQFVRKVSKYAKQTLSASVVHHLANPGCSSNDYVLKDGSRIQVVTAT